MFSVKKSDLKDLQIRERYICILYIYAIIIKMYKLDTFLLTVNIHYLGFGIPYDEYKNCL